LLAKRFRTGSAAVWEGTSTTRAPYTRCRSLAPAASGAI